MTQNIDTALAIQFADQVHDNGQQVRARLRDKVQVVPMMTQDMTVETLDSLEAIEITSRHQRTQGQDIVHGRRRMRLREFRCTIYLDQKDEVSVIVDAQRNYAAAVSKAIYRKFDRLVLEAALASVYTGRDMTTLVTATSDGVQQVDATSGATYEKLLEVMRRFNKYEIGTEVEEDIFLAISNDEMEDFMQETELTSGDFTRQFAVEKGKLVTAAGINLVQYGSAVTNPQLAVASSVRSCVAFVRDAIKVGMAKDAQIRVDERPDMNYTKQVQACMMMAAVRKEGARVQEFRTTVTA